MRKLLVLILLIINLSCSTEKITNFKPKALNDSMITIEGNETTFQSVLDKHKGKKVFIDVWASWCGDCLRSLPKVKALQKSVDSTKVDFVFLSVDKKQEKWQKAIKRFDIEGDHYFQKGGWDSNFNQFLDLDWIPRYMIIDEKGNILVYRAIEVDDVKIKNALK